MTMKSQADAWRDDTLFELDRLLMSALVDPDLKTDAQQGLAAAAGNLLVGWKQVVVVFSNSNPGYEFKDLPTESIRLVKKIEHMIDLLERLSK